MFKVPFLPMTMSLVLAIITSGIKENEHYKFKITVINTVTGKQIYTAGDNDLNLPNAMDNFMFNWDLKNLEFEFMYLTGLRVVEVISFTIDDYSPERKTIKVIGTLNYSDGYKMQKKSCLKRWQLNR